MIVCLALFAAKNLSSLKIETNILALLPAEKYNPLIKKALSQRQKHQQTLIFLIGQTQTPNSAANSAEQAITLAKTLEESQLFAHVNLKVDASLYAQTYQQLLPYRYQLLTASDRQHLQHSPDDFLSATVSALYSPLGIQRAATLGTDPLFTFANYLESLNPGDFELHQGIAVIHHKKQTYALLSAELKPGISIQAQQQLLTLYRQLHVSAAQNKVELLSAGLPLYNAFGAESAKNEISTVGLFSLLGIIFLVLYCFRSPMPLLLALTAIGSGVFAALLACMLLFDTLHIITLVFGSSLIGVCIDYSFHYFAEFYQRNDENSWDKLQRILPGITLGMLSSVLAYSALIFAPFPGLQQIAIFSAIGLVVAWLTVVLLMPLCMHKTAINRALPFAFFYRFYNHLWPQFYSQHRFIVLSLALAYCVFGFTLLKPVDDIRLIQQAPADLLKQENRIKDIVNQKQDSQFFIVQGKDIDQLLKNEEDFLHSLENEKAQDSLKGFDALSMLFPAADKQKQNYQLFKQQIFASKKLYNMLQELGMEDDAIKKIHQDFIDGNKPLAFKPWLKHMTAPIQELFLGCDKNNCASIISLSGIKNLSALQTTANKFASVILVDQVASINTVLFNYRQLATVFIAIAIIAITLLLSLLLSLRSALIIISTPALAITFTVASLSIINHLFSASTFSLFNVFALLLVLGISLDYAIFTHLGAEHKNTTALAVLLSLLTTLLAFGLLALSSTMVVHAFGLTLAIGVISAFLIAPLLPAKAV
ncbi:MAG: hypothetical protein HRU20_09750 [Pseudomonadales bacterium]|nr:hypothetical protein [Pseudomonadales bacterium]